MIIYTVLVFFCSFLYGLSAVLCKYGLQNKVDVHSFSLISLLMFLLKNKIWIIGVLLSFATNVAVIELQSFIDVSVVYPILNFSYVFVLILGYMFLNETLNKRQWIGVVTVICGTLLIIFIDDPLTGERTDIQRLFLINACSVIAIIYMMYKVYRQKIENYEIYYAICTGISFGNVETYIKANTNMVVEELGHFSVFSFESLGQFVTMWPFFMLVFFSIVGWVSMQITYSHGDISISVPLFAVIQSCITMTCGYLVFGEYFTLQKLLGVITIVSGVTMLILSSVSAIQLDTAREKT